MMTRYIKLTGDPGDREAVLEAGKIIREGGIVAFPTETVYGLGGDALNCDAAAKIYAAKGRPSDNPLIVHIADIGSLEKIAARVPEDARRLAGKFWPGPLTMIFHKKECVPDETTGGRKTVAVRFPDQRTAQELIRAAGGYVCAPSANISGKPSPTCGRDVMEDMDGRIDAVLDDGESVIGLESTIVDMTCDPPEMLRPGAVTPGMLKECIPDILIEAGSGQEGSGRDGEDHPRAPGMKYRHYAPGAPLYLIGPEEAGSGQDDPGGSAKADSQIMIDRIRELTGEAHAQGMKVGILTCAEHAAMYGAESIKVLGGESDEESLAHNLFRCLREFDREAVDVIYSETFDQSGIGFALMNRLKKAANAKGETHVES